MSTLLISDLHLTANPREEYRWRLFDWLAEILPQNDVKDLFILGDLTEAKDYHSAKLVNRIVNTLLMLYRNGGLHYIHILRGNHDGVDPRCAYFEFLGQYPSIRYIATPYTFPLGNQEILALPHTNDPVRDWEDIDMHNVDLILMHATVRGAVAENGQVVEGIPPSMLATAKRAKIYSGDIHVPQKVGRIEYVGAPYPVRFGDSFTPRAVLFEKGRARDLLPPAIRRGVIVVDATQASFASLSSYSKGDQVKVRIRLSPSEYLDWQKIKKNAVAACAEHGVELCALELERVPARRLLRRPGTAQVQRRTPQDIFNAFCASNKIDELSISVGGEILRGL